MAIIKISATEMAEAVGVDPKAFTADAGTPGRRFQPAGSAAGEGPGRRQSGRRFAETPNPRLQRFRHQRIAMK
jgi:hypothetical protein